MGSIMTQVSLIATNFDKCRTLVRKITSAQRLTGSLGLTRTIDKSEKECLSHHRRKKKPDSFRSENHDTFRTEIDESFRTQHTKSYTVKNERERQRDFK